MLLLSCRQVSTSSIDFDPKPIETLKYPCMSQQSTNLIKLECLSFFLLKEEMGSEKVNAIQILQVINDLQVA